MYLGDFPLLMVLMTTSSSLTHFQLSGISKGIGIGIGFSIITALIIYVMQKIIRLNIPVLSQYISDIVEIVERTK